MANLAAQQKSHETAIKYYSLVIQHSPYNPQNSHKYKSASEVLGVAPSLLRENNKLNSKTAYVDAHTNLAVMFVVSGRDIKEALDLCQEAIEMDPNQFESYVNFADILRKMDKRDEAASFTWKSIQRHIQESTKQPWSIPESVDIQSLGVV